jgi:hypothetical protein
MSAIYHTASAPRGLPDDAVRLIDRFAAPESPQYAAFAEKYGTRSKAGYLREVNAANDGHCRFVWDDGSLVQVSTCIVSPCIICCRQRETWRRCSYEFQYNAIHWRPNERVCQAHVGAVLRTGWRALRELGGINVQTRTLTGWQTIPEQYPQATEHDHAEMRGLDPIAMCASTVRIHVMGRTVNQRRRNTLVR